MSINSTSSNNNNHHRNNHNNKNHHHHHQYHYGALLLSCSVPVSHLHLSFRALELEVLTFHLFLSLFRLDWGLTAPGDVSAFMDLLLGM